MHWPIDMPYESWHFMYIIPLLFKKFTFIRKILLQIWMLKKILQLNSVYIKNKNNNSKNKIKSSFKALVAKETTSNSFSLNTIVVHTTNQECWDKFEVGLLCMGQQRCHCSLDCLNFQSLEEEGLTQSTTQTCVMWSG